MLRNINIILVVLGVTIECNGHGHLKLFDIVGSAHDRIHATVDKVAGGILGGLNLNFQGHIGVTEQRYPPQPPPPQPQPQPPGQQETIVVIIKDEGGDPQSNGNHGMRPNQYGQGHFENNNYNNNPQRPGYNNNQGQWNGNAQNSYGNNGQDFGNQNNCQNPYECKNPNQGLNHYGNQNGNYGQNQNPYQPNQGQNNYQGQQSNQGNGNNYGNGGYNQRPNQGNYQPLPDQPPQGHLENHGGDNNFNQPTTPVQETKPTYGSVHEIPTVNPVSDKTTEKDEPLFVPLNPNQYNYGGDKITINGPKREADKEKAAEDSDDDLPIDIRVGN
ncbi:hypothetical protein O0L34_g8624 [Tuta absoluta]|nr:hypothetical protein O0L34_g8624 [Tuta absoluta]